MLWKLADIAMMLCKGVTFRTYLEQYTEHIMLIKVMYSVLFTCNIPVNMLDESLAINRITCCLYPNRFESVLGFLFIGL